MGITFGKEEIKPDLKILRYSQKYGIGIFGINRRIVQQEGVSLSKFNVCLFYFATKFQAKKSGIVGRSIVLCFVVFIKKVILCGSIHFSSRPNRFSAQFNKRKDSTNII